VLSQITTKDNQRPSFVDWDRQPLPEIMVWGDLALVHDSTVITGSVLCRPCYHHQISSICGVIQGGEQHVQRTIQKLSIALRSEGNKAVVGSVLFVV